MDFVYFILMVGVLIFVHELGHFMWAKLFKVRVLRFSLGFGPRIAGVTRGETEYVLAAVPLGGYVRLLGENPFDQVGDHERSHAFYSQSLIKRILIVIAGPAMNLLLPIVLSAVVFLGDSELTPAVVGRVLPHYPAYGKLQAGDRIVSVNGDPIRTFYGLARRVEENAGVALEFEVQRGEDRLRQRITPMRSREVRPLDRIEHVGRIGVVPYQPAAVVGVASASSPAASAGLETFDVVIAAAGHTVRRWLDLESALHGNRGSLVPLSYLRPTKVAGAFGGLADFEFFEPSVAALAPDSGPAKGTARAGLELAELYVSHVIEDSPEYRMGLRAGDRLLLLDDEPLLSWASFEQRIKERGDLPHVVTWKRDSQLHRGELTLRRQSGVSKHGQVYDRHVLHIENWLPSRLDGTVPNPAPLSYALRESMRATAEAVELTVYSVVRLFQGRLTVKSIGGPLAIYEVAGTAAREGALNFLMLMAFVSVNLALLNLMPIPMLDGGQLVFLAVEAVTRRALSSRTREYASIAGLLVLLVVTSLAFLNDIERLWPRLISSAFE